MNDYQNNPWPNNANLNTLPSNPVNTNNNNGQNITNNQAAGAYHATPISQTNIMNNPNSKMINNNNNINNNIPPVIENSIPNNINNNNPNPSTNRFINPINNPQTLDNLDKTINENNNSNNINVYDENRLKYLNEPEYTGETKVKENIVNLNKKTIPITKELKTVLVIGIVLLIFIILMPIIFDFISTNKS